MSEKQNTARYRRTSEQLERDRQIQEESLRHKTTREELIADPTVEGPFPHGYVTDLLHWLGKLRPLREAAGLTLLQVAERTGIDQAALSRLENGRTPNPTLHTLWRYAEAIGCRLEVLLAEADETNQQKPTVPAGSAPSPLDLSRTLSPR